MPEIDDTFAECFDGLYSRILVTAKNKKWLEHIVCAVTGCATSCIGCGCEAGLDFFASPDETPDGRIGAAIQFWVGAGGKSPEDVLEHELLQRIGQCILTAPTSAVWDLTGSGESLPIGRKLGFFADGFQFEEQWHGRTVVNIPRMMGDFLIEKDLGYSQGIMGGNLWFFAESEDSALEASERAVAALGGVRGVITSFPGGVCASGSKIGSRYKFLKASTNHLFCPSIAGAVDESEVPPGVESIAEIVFNGLDMDTMAEAVTEALVACSDVSGLVKISAGNYDGKLGKHRLYLKE